MSGFDPAAYRAEQRRREPPARKAEAVDDRVAATLAAIRERNEQLRTRYGYVGGLLELAKAKDDVPRLLKALDAALKMADEWEAEGVDPSWQLTNEDAGAGLAGREHSSALRAVITAALTGEEAESAPA